MKVLVACEFSGRVRDAFRKKGHDAYSCDIIDTDSNPDYHLMCDVRKVLKQDWDLMIAHPPCTYLAISGARWFKDRRPEQMAALKFVKTLLNAPIPRIALENPVGVISSQIRKPDQIIQPWQFGHGEAKATCLWLKNLPPLKPTNVVEGRHPAILLAPDSKGRQQRRSLTYMGIARAMATQWGKLPAEVL